MKKILFSVFVLCLSFGTGFAQTLFLDTSVPTNDNTIGWGTRFNMFLGVSPKLELGGMARMHFTYLKDIQPEIPADKKTYYHDVSLGLGFKYYLVNNTYFKDRFYFNGNVEASTLKDDSGIDLSGYFGYTRQLDDLFHFSLEAGLKNRSFLYDTDYAKNNRMQLYAGFGLGVTMPANGLNGLLNRTGAPKMKADDKNKKKPSAID